MCINLYQTLSCRKYIIGLIKSSPIPNRDDSSDEAPNIYAVVTVVMVPRTL